MTRRSNLYIVLPLKYWDFIWNFQSSFVLLWQFNVLHLSTSGLHYAFYYFKVSFTEVIFVVNILWETFSKL
jgi:hypothetical protein